MYNAPISALLLDADEHLVSTILTRIPSHAHYSHMLTIQGTRYEPISNKLQTVTAQILNLICSLVCRSWVCDCGRHVCQLFNGRHGVKKRCQTWHQVVHQ